MTCSVETGQALVKAGLHPASGGSPANVCSGDMLLQALVACAGVALSAVATSTGFAVRDAKVHAEGDIDFRGTLGVDKAAPVGFRGDPARLCDRRRPDCGADGHARSVDRTLLRRAANDPQGPDGQGVGAARVIANGWRPIFPRSYSAFGAGPVEARKMSSAGRSSWRGGPPAKRRRAAARPFSTCMPATVVSGGSDVAASGMSL